jgi:flagellar hook-associated protein 3 FlgL
MSNNDMQFSLHIREGQLNRLSNQLASGSRIQELRDDPVAAAHSTRYLSKINHLSRFSRNSESLISDLQIAEGYMQSALNILHRAREIAVEGAHGIYSQEQQSYMGFEVNQLLNELVELANGKNGDNRTLFAGDKTRSQAFVSLKGHIPGVSDSVITQVNYTGTNRENLVEISQGSYIEANIPGNKIFWAEHQQIFSNIEASRYQVMEDQTFYLDGKAIDLKAGDNIHAIIDKINSSGAAVEASLDPVRNSLMLKTTVPHQIWIENGPAGRAMTDLGVVNDQSAPPANIHPQAVNAGGSAFDMLITLRDSLFRGDTLTTGGLALKGLDLGISSLISGLAKLGAGQSRLRVVSDRLSYEIPEVIGKNSLESDVDVTRSITDLRQLELNHRTALQTAGRILQPTLLDFLR